LGFWFFSVHSVLAVHSIVTATPHHTNAASATRRDNQHSLAFLYTANTNLMTITDTIFFSSQLNLIGGFLFWIVLLLS